MSGDAVAAGLVAAALSGAPSTLVTLARGEDLLESGLAAGSILLGEHAPAPLLLAAALPVHVALSVGWAGVLAAAVPRGREIEGGALGGLAIAALDLLVIGRRFPRVRALPQGRQWADHLAFGLIVGAVLKARRAGHPSPTPARDPFATRSRPVRAPLVTRSRRVVACAIRRARLEP
jgi:hypothetical protein